MEVIFGIIQFILGLPQARQLVHLFEQTLSYGGLERHFWANEHRRFELRSTHYFSLVPFFLNRTLRVSFSIRLLQLLFSSGCETCKKETPYLD